MIRKFSSTSASSHQRLTSRAWDVIRRNPFRTAAVTGAVAAAAYQRHKTKKEEEAEAAKKNRVLVLPFYKMKIVEKSENDWRSEVQKRGDSESLEMPIDELVDLIHQAAADPKITALYGILGHGHGFAAGGWAHIEELRNALLVFRQSHRVHKEPGRPIENRRARKPMYLYTDTFLAPTSTGGADMKEYYVASAFTHVHLQSQGDVNLFGLHVTNTFYRDFLTKYGIMVHVWKHGAYKNFANSFTHSRYTKEHLENVSNLIREINQHLCHGIYVSRHGSLKHYEYNGFWSMVHHAGSIPAEMAHRIGFVDYMPKLNPLDDLLLANQEADKADAGTETRKEMEGKWGNSTDMPNFKPTSKISISEYAKQKKQKKAKEERQWKIHDRLRNLADKNAGVRSLMSAMGYSAPHYNFNRSEFSEDKMKGRKEKIAVLNIRGAITDTTARKVERALRKLKQETAKNKDDDNAPDIKALVLRVDSPGGAVTACETIFQQLDDLPQKVVVSFGNVSASGGYYVSANAERIFASPTTITGSIGVFMMRADLRGLAKQWGITFDSVNTSEMSASFDPYQPINSRIADNFAAFAERTYLRFKGLVSDGRGMDMDQVETVAQGRVWTGEQAKEIGLVDELGGLDRAVAYCQRNYTSSGQADVVSWPPKKSLWEALQKSKMGGGDDEDWDDVEVPSVAKTVLTTAEDLFGIRGLFPGSMVETSQLDTKRPPQFPSTATGVMLTVDENAAIRCLLEENDVPDLLSTLPPNFWE